MQNLLPQYTVCQPVGQHPGTVAGHWQCFCVSQKPTPDFDQSVASAVGSFGSNDLTPVSHCLRISFLEASKASCSSGDHCCSAGDHWCWGHCSSTGDRVKVRPLSCSNAVTVPALQSLAQQCACLHLGPIENSSSFHIQCEHPSCSERR